MIEGYSFAAKLREPDPFSLCHKTHWHVVDPTPRPESRTLSLSSDQKSGLFFRKRHSVDVRCRTRGVAGTACWPSISPS